MGDALMPFEAADPRLFRFVISLFRAAWAAKSEMHQEKKQRDSDEPGSDRLNYGLTKDA